MFNNLVADNNVSIKMESYLCSALTHFLFFVVSQLGDSLSKLVDV